MSQVSRADMASWHQAMSNQRMATSSAMANTAFADLDIKSKQTYRHACSAAVTARMSAPPMHK
jgi:hypothetical protein